MNADSLLIFIYPSGKQSDKAYGLCYGYETISVCSTRSWSIDLFLRLMTYNLHENDLFSLFWTFKDAPNSQRVMSLDKCKEAMKHVCFITSSCLVVASCR